MDTNEQSTSLSQNLFFDINSGTDRFTQDSERWIGVSYRLNQGAAILRIDRYASLSASGAVAFHGSEQVQGYGRELVGWMAEARAAEWGLVLVAPFIGSFLGLLIQRLPEGSPISRGRSHCDACGAALQPRDLVPILSWVMLGGRCRFCRQPLGWFYPGVELAAVAIALASVLIDHGPGAWLDCFFGWWLLALGWIDLRCWLLPDALTLPLIIAGLAAAFLFNPDQLTDRALGAALGYLSLIAIAALYRRFRDREGLGGGDPKLLAASGAWLGAAALPQVILLAALSALAAAGFLRLRGIRLGIHSALPFGPFLAVATWVLWLLGPFD
jgi:leader peptidase (prepilin peptidase) / N-methyltransferase